MEKAGSLTGDREWWHSKRYNAGLFCSRTYSMTDAATRQLLQYIAATPALTLWLADEQIDAGAVRAAAVRPQLLAVSNRCDVVSALAARAIPATATDFTAAWPAGLRHIALRIAKEKALVHYWINRALEQLPPGGELFLSGYKNEGIKTYIDKAAARAGNPARIDRHEGAISAVIVRGGQLGAPLPDQDYAVLRPVAFAADLTLWSRPGIFGWQKLDAGSVFLVEHLDAVWSEPPARVLDLGCGYGYLTVQAARHWSAAEFVATDNNVAAVAACARNLEQENIRGLALADDCAATLCDQRDADRFDAILCNPPFHQGFDVEGELTRRFLQSTRHLLQRRGGRALFVVNQFIPLERKAAELFGSVDIVARNRGFKLIALGR
jgi:16S rRNA (guanine1207-N2)-methyltransferase